MAKKENNKEKKKNNFFKDLKAELKKVTWPTFKKLVNNTSAVIAVVLIVAIIVFALDVCFENLNKFGVGKLKSLVSSNVEEVVEDEDLVQTEDISDLEENVETTPGDTETTDEVVETDVNSESNSEEVAQ